MAAGLSRVALFTGNPAARKPMKSGLLEHGFDIAVHETQELFQDGFNAGRVDVLIVDLEHGPADVPKLCHAIKRDPVLKEAPLVLLVTEDHLGRMDFSLGVDDYLTLPVSPKRLAERVKFLLWKQHKVDLKDGLQVDDLSIDFHRYEVRLDGEPIDLTYKEFELLKFLATHPGRVFSREVLLDKVWGYDYYGGTRTVDVHIRRLRSKIELGRREYIQTVRNVGYKFIVLE